MFFEKIIMKKNATRTLGWRICLDIECKMQKTSNDKYS